MTVLVAEELRRFTVEEYLELEKYAEVKHEYYRGKLIAMPGESKSANLINSNLKLLLTKPLRKKGFHTFDHDVKVTVKSGEVYRYPDFVVAPKTDNQHDYLVMEPILLAEVASEGSWHTDTFVKLREYLKLPALQYYLIISQDACHVEFCFRDEKGEWDFRLFREPTDEIPLQLFNLKIPLAELYEEVEFPPA